MTQAYGTQPPQAPSGMPLRSEVARRALELISDGVIDRGGPKGLARRVGRSVDELESILVGTTGQGSAELARASRARTARLLLEEPASLQPRDVATATGFDSVRVMLSAVHDASRSAPADLGGRRRTAPARTTVTVRLPRPEPMVFADTLRFLRLRALPATESVTDTTYTRTLRAQHGPALFTVSDADRWLDCRITVTDLRDITSVLVRIRRLLDLDADSASIDNRLAEDAALAPLVTARPGLRSPGAVDGFEIAVRGIIGQQISVAAARTRLDRIVTAAGKQALPEQNLMLFPSPEEFAAMDPGTWSLPLSRARSLGSLAQACADGRLTLDPTSDRDQERATLLSLHGIGPWTADYIRMRAMKDPDILLTTDLGVVRSAQQHGFSLTNGRPDLAPWRSYISNHLWAAAH